MDIKIVESTSKAMAMHPKKFAMWLFLVSVTMLFVSLTSAYIVRQAEGNWNYFDLPSILYYTTGVIVLSSITMHWSYRFAKKEQVKNLMMSITLTALLGILFLGGQFYAWKELVENNVYFVGNPSGSFLYVLIGLHGLHLVSAILFLGIVLVSSYRFRKKNIAQIEMCTTYWHFLGALWLYLFFFVLVNQ